MALRGIKVVELAGLAPGPFCGMVLSDFGASVVRVDRVGDDISMDCLANGKKSISLNLKKKEGIDVLRKLCKQSDVVMEPFRPGVMENLGLGPKVLLKENPKLIYARLSGYGQTGALAQRAGHDINYVAISGILSILGRSNEKPFVPTNMLADFGGGGLMCALGIVMALFERNTSGKGQVVDCSMTEGTSYLGSWLYRSQIHPFWGNERGKNMLDGGAHFYEVYKTKDNKYMAVGAIEQKFYFNLLAGLGFTADEVPQFDNFEENKEILTKRFLEKTQKEWCEIFDNVDACVTPVLTFDEATNYLHNKQSKSFVPCSDQEKLIPAPAPKLSRSPAESQAQQPALKIGQHTVEILKSLNYNNDVISDLEKNEVIQISRQSKM